MGYFRRIGSKLKKLDDQTIVLDRIQPKKLGHLVISSLMFEVH